MTTERTMYQWFADTAGLHPDHLALRVGGNDLTYRELAGAAARVAGDLLRVAHSRPKRVGLLSSRNIGAYAAYLATLRLGVTLVPLNTESPAARNAGIIRAAGVEVLAHAPCDDQLAAELAEHTGVPLVRIGDGDALGHGRLTGLPEAGACDPDDVAYIIFTSGSTGAPKGVPIRHRQFSTWLSYMVTCFDCRPDIRVAQTSDLAWDVSLWNLFIPWSCGGAVVVPERRDMLAPSEFINTNEITHWFSTPSVVTSARLLGDIAPGCLPTLRWCVFAGEALTVDNALAWYEAMPNGTLCNTYGPTEITCTCLTYPLPRATADWPEPELGGMVMGPAYPTVEAAVVRPDGRAAGDGEDGELLLRGPQRLDGYLDPVHNIGRFASWDGRTLVPYDGSEPLTREHWYRPGDGVRVRSAGYYFVGRLDDQVKVRGVRVEPGEVEAVLHRHRHVESAVVVPYTGEDGSTELAGFHTGRPGVEAELIEFLAARLPEYMVPRLLLWTNGFPLTTNGKVDRRVLVERARAVAEGGSAQEWSRPA
jgi:amino acid adenylation domain-containing protein